MGASRLDALVYPTVTRKAALIGEPQRGANCQLSAVTVLPATATIEDILALSYLDLGLTQEAHGAALRCANLFPGYALPMADLGVVALLEGRPQAAADTLTLALRRNWHGQEAAEMAAKENYVAALREMRLREALKK